MTFDHQIQISSSLSPRDSPVNSEDIASRHSLDIVFTRQGQTEGWTDGQMDGGTDGNRRHDASSHFCHSSGGVKTNCASLCNSQVSRKLHSASHEQISWMTAFLFTDRYNVLSDDMQKMPFLPHGMLTKYGFNLVGKKKQRNLNFHLALNLFTLPGAWCPTSGEPRQSPRLSLETSRERNVQQNGNHNTLSPPRLLLKAFTVHWLRHPTMHW